MTQVRDIEYPKILPWLQYCDRHPCHSGEELTALTAKFSEEGFHDIENLTGTHLSADKFSKWLGIMRRLALHLLSYADHDVQLAKARNLKLMLLEDGEA